MAQNKKFGVNVGVNIDFTETKMANFRKRFIAFVNQMEDDLSKLANDKSAATAQDELWKKAFEYFNKELEQHNLPKLIEDQFANINIEDRFKELARQATKSFQENFNVTGDAFDVIAENIENIFNKINKKFGSATIAELQAAGERYINSTKDDQKIIQHAIKMKPSKITKIKTESPDDYYTRLSDARVDLSEAYKKVQEVYKNANSTWEQKTIAEVEFSKAYQRAEKSGIIYATDHIPMGKDGEIEGKSFSTIEFADEMGSLYRSIGSVVDRINMLTNIIEYDPKNPDSFQHGYSEPWAKETTLQEVKQILSNGISVKEESPKSENKPAQTETPSSQIESKTPVQSNDEIRETFQKFAAYIMSYIANATQADTKALADIYLKNQDLFQKGVTLQGLNELKNRLDQDNKYAQVISQIQQDNTSATNNSANIQKDVSEINANVKNLQVEKQHGSINDFSTANKYEQFAFIDTKNGKFSRVVNGGATGVSSDIRKKLLSEYDDASFDATIHSHPNNETGGGLAFSWDDIYVFAQNWKTFKKNFALAGEKLLEFDASTLTQEQMNTIADQMHQRLEYYAVNDDVSLGDLGLSQNDFQSLYDAFDNNQIESRFSKETLLEIINFLKHFDFSMSEPDLEDELVAIFQKTGDINKSQTQVEQADIIQDAIEMLQQYAPEVKGALNRLSQQDQYDTLVQILKEMKLPVGQILKTHNVKDFEFSTPTPRALEVGEETTKTSSEQIVDTTEITQAISAVTDELTKLKEMLASSVGDTSSIESIIQQVLTLSKSLPSLYDELLANIDKIQDIFDPNNFSNVSSLSKTLDEIIEELQKVTSTYTALIPQIKTFGVNINSSLTDIVNSVAAKFKSLSNINVEGTSRSTADNTSLQDVMKNNILELVRRIREHNDSTNIDQDNPQQSNRNHQEMAITLLPDGSIKLNAGEHGTVPWEKIYETMISNSIMPIVSLHSHPYLQWDAKRIVNDSFSSNNGDLGAFKRNVDLGIASGMITGDIVRLFDTSKISSKDYEKFLNIFKKNFAEITKNPTYISQNGITKTGAGNAENMHQVNNIFEQVLIKSLSEAGLSTDLFKKFDVKNPQQLDELANVLVNLSYSVEQVTSEFDIMLKLLANSANPDLSEVFSLFRDFDTKKIDLSQFFNGLLRSRGTVVDESAIKQFIDLLNTSDKSRSDIEARIKNSPKLFDAINNIIPGEYFSSSTDLINSGWFNKFIESLQSNQGDILHPLLESFFDNYIKSYYNSYLGYTKGEKSIFELYNDVFTTTLNPNAKETIETIDTSKQNTIEGNLSSIVTSLGELVSVVNDISLNVKKTDSEKVEDLYKNLKSGKTIADIIAPSSLYDSKNVSKYYLEQVEKLAINDAASVLNTFDDNGIKQILEKSELNYEDIGILHEFIQNTTEAFSEVFAAKKQRSDYEKAYPDTKIDAVDPNTGAVYSNAEYLLADEYDFYNRGKEYLLAALEKLHAYNTPSVAQISDYSNTLDFSRLTEAIYNLIDKLSKNIDNYDYQITAIIERVDDCLTKIQANTSNVTANNESTTQEPWALEKTLKKVLEALQKGIPVQKDDNKSTEKPTNQNTIENILNNVIEINKKLIQGTKAVQYRAKRKSKPKVAGETEGFEIDEMFKAKKSTTLMQLAVFQKKIKDSDKYTEEIRDLLNHRVEEFINKIVNGDIADAESLSLLQQEFRQLQMLPNSLGFKPDKNSSRNPVTEEEKKFAILEEYYRLTEEIGKNQNNTELLNILNKELNALQKIEDFNELIKETDGESERIVNLRLEHEERMAKIKDKDDQSESNKKIKEALNSKQQLVDVQKKIDDARRKGIKDKDISGLIYLRDQLSDQYNTAVNGLSQQEREEFDPKDYKIVQDYRIDKQAKDAQAKLAKEKQNAADADKESAQRQKEALSLLKEELNLQQKLNDLRNNGANKAEITQVQSQIDVVKKNREAIEQLMSDDEALIYGQDAIDIQNAYNNKAMQDQIKARQQAEVKANADAEAKMWAEAEAKVKAEAKANTDMAKIQKEAEQYARKIGQFEALKDNTANADLQNALQKEIDAWQDIINSKKQSAQLDETLIENARQRGYNEKLNALELQSINRQTAQSRKSAKFGQTENVITKSNDLMATITNNQYDNDKIVAFTQSLQKLKTLYTSITSKSQYGVVISQADIDNLRQARNETETYRKEVASLVDEMELDSNQILLDATVIKGATSYKEQLVDIVMKATDGKAKIGDFDVATNTLNYTVKTGAKEITNFSAHIRELDNNVIQTTESIEPIETLMDSIFRKTKEVAVYLAGSFSLQNIVGNLKQGVQYVKEIDSAMTELRKVTDETEETYDAFLKTASKTASKVGSTIQEVVSSTADFARVGYTIEEAAQLAENAQILMNVSEYTDISSATNALISALQAFGYSADESLGVIDVFNTIGNNYAISTSELASSLTDSASALKLAGNSLEQSSALITAGNTILQDPSQVSTALKVVSLRIRGVTSDLSDMGEETDSVLNKSKLQAKIKALTGVDILDANNTFRSTYDILVDIGNVYEDLDSMSQASVLELLAGKSRANALAAVIQNIDVLKDSYEDAMNASGSSTEELNTYLESIQGRIDLFNNALQTMWSNAIDTDLIKWFVDLGTTLLNLVDDVGLFRTAIIALGTYLNVKKFKIDFSQFFDIKTPKNLKNLFTQPIAAIKDTLKEQTTTINYGDYLQEVLNNAKVAELANPLNAGFRADTKNAEEALQRYQELYNEQNNAIQVKLDAANRDLKDAQNALFDYWRAESEGTESGIESEEELSEALEEARQKVQDLETEQQNLGNVTTITSSNLVKNIKIYSEAIQSAISSMAMMYIITTVFQTISDLISSITSKTKDATEQYEELQTELSKTKSNLKDLNSEFDDIQDQIDEINENISLSFTDEEELKRLQQESVELQRQIDLTETLQKQQQQGVNEGAVQSAEKYTQTNVGSGQTDFENVWSKAGSGATLGAAFGYLSLGALGTAALGSKLGAALGTTIAPIIGTLFGTVIGAVAGALVGVVVGGVQNALDEEVGDSLDKMKENYIKLQQEYAAAQSNFQSTGKNYDKVTEAQEALSAYESEMSNYITTLNEEYSKIDWETATESQRQAMQDFYDIQDEWAIASNGQNAKVNAMDRIFGTNATEDAKALKAAVEDALNPNTEFSFEDIFTQEQYDAIIDRLENMGLSLGDVKYYFVDMAQEANDATESISTYYAVKEISSLTSGVNSLKDAFAELKEEGIVSAETLTSLFETFGELESWNTFVTAASSGTAALKEFESVAAEMAEEYIDGILSTGNYNAAERLTYISNLASLGVTNAEEYIDDRLEESMWTEIEKANINWDAYFDSKNQGYIESQEQVQSIIDEYGLDIENEELQKNLKLIQQKNTAEQKLANLQKQQAEYREWDSEQIALIKVQQNIEDLLNAYNMFIDAAVSSETKPDEKPQIIAQAKSYKGQAELLAKQYGWTIDENNQLVIPITTQPTEVTNEQIEEAQAKVDKLTDAISDTMTAEVQLKIDFYTTSDIVDELQSVYDTLTSAVEEYEENGGSVSIDTMQTLLQLEPKYLAMLYNEQGQIELNKDALLQVAQARIYDMAQKQIDSIITSASNAAKSGEVEKLKELTKVTYDAAEAQSVLNTAALAALKIDLESAGLGDYYNDIEAQVRAIEGLYTKSAGSLETLYSTFGSSSSEEDALSKIQEKYERQITELDNQETYIENQISQLEAKEETVNKGLYEEQIRLEEEKIEQYKSERTELYDLYGTLSEGTDKWYETRDAIWEVEHNIQGAISAIIDYNDAITQLYVKAFDDIGAAYDNQSDYWEDQQSYIEAYKEYIELQDKFVNPTEYYGKLQDIESKQLAANREQLEEYIKVRNAAIESGSVEVGSDAWVEMESNIRDVEAAILDNQKAIEQYKEDVKDLYVEYFEQISNVYNQLASLFDYRSDYIEKEIDLLTEQGTQVTKVYYDRLIENEQAQLDNNIELKATLEKELAAAVSGGLEEGSEQWWTMQSNIYDVTSAIQDGEIAIQQYNNSIKELYVEGFSKLQTAYSDITDVFEDQISYIEKYNELLELQDEAVTVGSYNAMISIETQKLTENTEALNALVAAREDAVENGNLVVGSEEWVEMTANIRETEAAILDSKVAIEELKQSIHQLYVDTFEEINEAFGNKTDILSSQQDYINGYISYLETLNVDVPQAAYDKLIEIEQQKREENVDNLIQARGLIADLEAQGLNAADEEWVNATKKAIELEKAIQDNDAAIAEWNNTIQEMDFSAFDDYISRLDDLKTEMSNINDLMSHDDVAFEDGTWTKEGITSLAMLYQQMELAQAQTQEYADEVDKLNKSYEDGEISEQAYYERLQVLQDGQWDAISTYEDLKDSIVDLNSARIDAIEDGINKEIEAYEKLIEVKQEELDAERDLHDFKNSTEEQTKSIAETQRKIASLSNSTAASDIAELRQLQAQLTEQEKELNESYYTHAKDQQSEALSEESEQFSEVRNDALDTMREKLEDIDTVVAESMEQLLVNADVVLGSLNDISAEYGVNISSNLLNPWKTAATMADSFKATVSDALGTLVNEDNILTAFGYDTTRVLGEVNTTTRDLNFTLDTFKTTCGDAFKVSGIAAEMFRDNVVTSIHNVENQIGNENDGFSTKLESYLSNPWENVTAEDGPLTTFSQDVINALDDALTAAQSNYQTMKDTIEDPWTDAAVNTFSENVISTLKDAKDSIATDYDAITTETYLESPFANAQTNMFLTSVQNTLNNAVNTIKAAAAEMSQTLQGAFNGVKLNTFNTNVADGLDTALEAVKSTVTNISTEFDKIFDDIDAIKTALGEISVPNTDDGENNDNTIPHIGSTGAVTSKSVATTLIDSLRYSGNLNTKTKVDTLSQYSSDGQIYYALLGQDGTYVLASSVNDGYAKKGTAYYQSNYTKQLARKEKASENVSNTLLSGGSVTIDKDIFSASGYTKEEIENSLSSQVFNKLVTKGKKYTQAEAEKLWQNTWRKKISYYAKGTMATTKDQLAITDEPQWGDELTLVPGKSGNLSFMRKGTSVIPADITANLVDWGKINPSDIIDTSKYQTLVNTTATNNNYSSLSFDSLVHIDNCTEGAIDAVKKIVNDSLENFSKQLNYRLKHA